MTIPNDIIQVAQEIVDRIAKVHVLKGDCIEDVATAIFAERERSRQLLSEAEKREREATAIDADKIAKALTGHIAGTCCHKTGAVNDDPKCECRILAAAAVSALSGDT